jgi:hypothetical protein
MTLKLVLPAAATVFFYLPPVVEAQGRGGPPGPTPTGKAAAPEDLTGYWVSLVTEDWRYRMVTPPKGDYASVPLNPEGRRVADTWDPAKDEAAGLQCKSYGAAALMRVPTRVRITWADDNALRVETDAGTQTREFHFGQTQPPSGDAGWQGFSAANWEFAGGGRGGRGGPPRGGSLKVVTTHLRPGYLRKNGVPYSANTILTEYYTRTDETDGTSYLIITTMVDDPQYLQQTFVTSTHFKKEADSAKWSPSACTSR